jgi:hypothetical protein
VTPAGLQLRDAVVVVTGGGSRDDLDGDAAKAVAAESDGRTAVEPVAGPAGTDLL